MLASASSVSLALRRKAALHEGMTQLQHHCITFQRAHRKTSERFGHVVLGVRIRCSNSSSSSPANRQSISRVSCSSRLRVQRALGVRLLAPRLPTHLLLSSSPPNASRLLALRRLECRGMGLDQYCARRVQYYASRLQFVCEGSADGLRDAVSLLLQVASKVQVRCNSQLTNKLRMPNEFKHPTGAHLPAFFCILCLR